MPVKELGPHFEFASWRVPQFQRAIEYPPEVMEEIRAFACDELLQLSHGGDDVGGVLFGTRRDDLVRILTWRPIACEHTQGEGLRLSYNDRMNLAVQLEVARQNADLKDLRPVGWFVSHLRGGVALLDSDLEIYNGFFPDLWQVAMVICPKGNGRAQAGFFVREADYKVQTEASYQSFELAPLHPAPPPPAPAATKVAAEPAPIEAAPPPPQPPPVEKPRAPEAATPRQAEPPKFPPPLRHAPPALQAPAPEAPALQAPTFQIEEEVPTRERWFWAIPILLALGIAAFMLYQRQTPSPNASIALRAWTEAQTVQLSWDATSRAIQDSYRGQMEINDGGKNSQISLSGEQLHSGKMSYVPQSNDVGFVMTVYPAHGDPFHDSTRLIVPSLDAAPTQPPQLIPANPAPATPPPAAPTPAAAAPVIPPAAPAVDQSALQQEVQRLKEDLGKERARANELQNLVRILENRLGIQPEPKSTSRP